MIKVKPFSLKTRYDFRIEMKYPSNDRTRPWLFVFAPDGKEVLNEPLEKYYPAYHGWYMTDTFDNAAAVYSKKRKPTWVTKKHILALFKGYGA